MAADYTIKQGDTAPALTDALTYSDGTFVDLTGCTVTLTMRSLIAPAPIAITGPVTVTNATAGALSYAPTVADTTTPGLFMGNWVVTFPNGKVMSFPTGGYIAVNIEPNLASAPQQLVSLGDVKEYLNLPANDRTHDAKLVRFIRAIRPMIEAITGPLITATFDERYDGGEASIVLRNRPNAGPGTTPLLTVTAIHEFVGTIDYTLTVVTDASLGTLYSCSVDPRLGTVTRRTVGGGATAFYPGVETVHVTYQAGQTVIPPNVHEAALEAIRVNYMTTQAVGRGRRAPTDDLDVGAPLGFFLPRRVLEMLSPNRRAPAIA